MEHALPFDFAGCRIDCLRQDAERSGCVERDALRAVRLRHLWHPEREEPREHWHHLPEV